MKKIKLTQNKVALVDDSDFEWLSRWQWRYHSKGYATRTYYKNNKRMYVLLHREIMRPLEGLVVDHINHDTLDNRRRNLRICTRAQNAWNSKHSDTKNISWFKPAQLWRFRVVADKKETVKYFKSKHEALEYKARNIHLYHGDFARS